MSMSEYLLRKYKKLNRKLAVVVESTDSMADRVGIIEAGYEDVRNDLTNEKGRTTTLTKRFKTLEDFMAENNARIDAAVAGIEGDITSLKAAAQASAEANTALQARLDAALADQGSAVQAAVTEAVAAERAAADTANAALADRLEALDAQTPGAAAPVDETPVDEPAPVDIPVDETPAPPVDETPVDETPAPVEPRTDEV